MKLQASKECITGKQKSIIIYKDLQTAWPVRASRDCGPADESIYTEILSKPETTTVSESKYLPVTPEELMYPSDLQAFILGSYH